MEQRGGKFNGRLRAALQPSLISRGPYFKGASAGSRQSNELEGVSLAPDMAGVEVAAAHQGWCTAKAREQFAPPRGRLVGFGIRGRRPAEMGHLAGMMGDVTGEQPLFA